MPAVVLGHRMVCNAPPGMVGSPRFPRHPTKEQVGDRWEDNHHLPALEVVMNLRFPLALVLGFTLACAGSTETTSMSDDEAQKVADDLLKAAETADQAAKEAAAASAAAAAAGAAAAGTAVDAAADATAAANTAAAAGAAVPAADAAAAAAAAAAEAAKTAAAVPTAVKVSTVITVPVAQKATIMPKSRSAIVAHAKSKGYSRVTDIVADEKCSATVCTVTVSGDAWK